MNRQHLRGFFNIHPVPYHRAFHHWMAGANARFWFLIAVWHLLAVGFGVLIGKVLL
jgi:hypothetical protein